MNCINPPEASQNMGKEGGIFVWKNSLEALVALLKKYRGRIAYYAAVAAVLTAVAFAAEGYRSGEGELTLPAVPAAPVIRQAEAGIPIRKPNGMELSRPFSSLPAWNHDLKQWECHAAADYGISGGEVFCLEGGELLTVGESGVYGGFVELDCGERLYRYASIAPSEALQAGMRLEAGDFIGVCDDSMPGEAYLGAHLHLELYEDGIAADFEALADKIEAGWID